MYFKDSDREIVVKDVIMDHLPLIGFIILFIIGIIIMSLGNRVRTTKVVDNNDNYYDESLSYYISLKGDEEMTLYLGEKYIEPGYAAADSRGNDLTDKVIVDNPFDTNKIATYIIRYTLHDTVKVRKVKVTKKPVGKTKLHLKGNLNIYLNLGEEYNEPGYEAVDTLDGDITDLVKVESSLDINKVGTYSNVYKVTNSSGIETSSERTITVINTDVRVTLDNNNTYTNKGVNINILVNDDYFDYMLLPDGRKVTEKSYTYNAPNNGNYKFVVYNVTGGGKEVNVNVNTVNTTSPTGSCSGSYQNGKSTINIKANDDIGIDKYVIDGVTYTDNKITLDKEVKNVNVTVYDNAGNSSSISCKLEDKNVYSSFDNISKYKSKSLSKNVSVNYYVTSNGIGFTYWAYVPNKLTNNLPVIVYMPGLGEQGNDYQTGAKTAIANGPIHEVVKYGYSYDAIILHMEVPAGDYVYSYLDSYIELTNKVVDEFKANKNKRSIIGFSHGCYGLMNIMKNHKKYFSAAVPIGCDPKNRASYFKYTPTWAFAGAGDGVSSMPGFVNQINAMGGNARFTRPTYHNHNVLDDNYSILRDNNYRVIDWMISQSR